MPVCAVSALAAAERNAAAKAGLNKLSLERIPQELSRMTRSSSAPLHSLSIIRMGTPPTADRPS
jgi:hypothetical protein